MIGAASQLCASLVGASLALAAPEPTTPTERDASAPLEAASTDDGAETAPVVHGRRVAPAHGRRPAGVPATFTRSTALRPQIGVEPSAFQAAQGVSSEGRWQASATAGYPWWGVRLQLGLRHGLSPVVEVQTALARRWRPAAGLSMLWVNLPRLRIGGEALFGWLFQAGELSRRGPNAELRVRVAVPLRRLAPYVMLGSQHTLLADRTTIVRPGGEERSWSLRGEWTGWGTVGLAIPITTRVGLDLGVDLTWVDAPETIAIPGGHGGIIIGGFRQTRATSEERERRKEKRAEGRQRRDSKDAARTSPWTPRSDIAAGVDAAHGGRSL